MTTCRSITFTCDESRCEVACAISTEDTEAAHIELIQACGWYVATSHPDRSRWVHYCPLHAPKPTTTTPQDAP